MQLPFLAEAFIKSKRFVSTDFKLIEKKFKLHVGRLLVITMARTERDPRRAKNRRTSPTRELDR